MPRKASCAAFLVCEAFLEPYFLLTMQAADSVSSLNPEWSNNSTAMMRGIFILQHACVRLFWRMHLLFCILQIRPEITLVFQFMATSTIIAPTVVSRRRKAEKEKQY